MSSKNRFLDDCFSFLRACNSVARRGNAEISIIENIPLKENTPKLAEIVRKFDFEMVRLVDLTVNTEIFKKYS